MEILHTPWRRKYVISARDYPGCPFCDLLAAKGSDQDRFILHRADTAFLVLNIYPYTPGHLMAVPFRHVSSTEDLKPGQLLELLNLCRLAEKILRRAYGCRCVHAGANLGQAAGAGVLGHLHFHIVARPEDPLWERCRRDSEPPESLEETFRRLQEALATF